MFYTNRRGQAVLSLVSFLVLGLLAAGGVVQLRTILSEKALLKKVATKSALSANFGAIETVKAMNSVPNFLGKDIAQGTYFLKSDSHQLLEASGSVLSSSTDSPKNLLSLKINAGAFIWRENCLDPFKFLKRIS